MEMRQLDPNMAAPERVHERSEAAAITGEVAERLLELAEILGEAKAQRWVLRVAGLFGTDCPRSAWVYLRLATGDLSEITASHEQHAALLARTKQGEHKEHKKALLTIARHFPELARAIQELEAK